MERIKGLKEYITYPKYRKALGLPEEVTESYTFLAQGEYNINYLFVHPVTGQKLLLRVNCGSQLHLDNQIEYEYHALELLYASGRVPRAYYVDGSRERLNHGILVMEYLPGEKLDYRKDWKLAAHCLADIHSVKINHAGLICQENPLRAILEECEEMVKVYMDSPLGNNTTKRKIRRMLDKGWDEWKKIPLGDVYCCCINTELNSTNFLINGEEKKNYLIDWEKPLYGDPAQDLGHFLAPTTTFWKTDVILRKNEAETFLEEYIRAVDGRFPTKGLKERVYAYIPITCLRGITWCAMAWVQYQQPDKLIFNESTFRRLEVYLSDEFLEALAYGK
ncbi:aminoglycoside phosphotransferase family protein [Acetivibrio ethanolgignens]|uniref:Aminoglycoside phosphotransferase n=1 Tax=Acetivibrio ethanolgignens TaxID=290052 RepID=A0A0V8QCJ2_9FIRM|nr:aminoglycoside phosphotransferase family protein [Acetivibrio ethanolgignens]KSV57801.1 aminoglycoside phosphotransferase [Acetivibrio ethanolgignens]